MAPAASVSPHPFDHVADSSRMKMARREATTKFSLNSVEVTDTSPSFRLITKRFKATRESVPAMTPKPMVAVLNSSSPRRSPERAESVKKVGTVIAMMEKGSPS